MAATTPLAVVVLCSILLAPPVPADETTAPPTPAQMAAMERVRPLVDAIWLDARTPSEQPRMFLFWEVTDKLIAIGPDVVPFLTAEMELMDPATFHFCAYALGRLGGRDAEVALRRAVRAADAQGGRFGAACKRYALFGLALLGAADVMDLMQSGESMHSAEMVPELPLVTHMAILIGAPAAPFLEKQLDAYSADPASTEKLEDALAGLGRVGDASLIPKVVPLLSGPASEVQGLAADAITRLGDPRLCEKSLPALSSPDPLERRFVAKSFERWKPEPCYKAMLARLEVETDTSVRALLYNTIVAMGGESSVEVLRLYLKTGNPYDQANVIVAIGQAGSKKGLNMLRSLLTDESSATVIRSLQSIAAIGGEGAIDTLLASTSDRRRPIAYAARDILSDMGVNRVAPRIAAELLLVAHEPVGDLTYRTPIAQWGDTLVKFGYTEPVDDLAAAAEVQTDPEIKDALTSCVRRLRLIAKNGDDVSAWTTAYASPFPDVRRLADRRLAEIGTTAAIRALGARLAKTDLSPEERAEVLTAIGEARADGGAEFIERHLADPVYDTFEFRDSRSTAAWAARRLGGDRMVRALRSSAVRRDGRDWATLVYLAVLEKTAALPTLKTMRVRRLRYPQTPFGHQDALLEGILLDMAAGRDIKAFDLPPGPLFEK